MDELVMSSSLFRFICDFGRGVLWDGVIVSDDRSGASSRSWRLSDSDDGVAYDSVASASVDVRVVYVESSEYVPSCPLSLEGCSS